MYVHQTHTINTNLSQGSLNEGRKRPLLISSKQEITFIEDSIVTFFWRPSPRHEGLDSPRLASRDLKIIQELSAIYGSHLVSHERCRGCCRPRRV